MGANGYYYAEADNLELIFTEGQARHYPRHVHVRHWTIGTVRQGSVFLATDAYARRLHAGQQFIIRPHEPHSLSVEQESSLLVLCCDGSVILASADNRSRLNRLPILQESERAAFEKAIAACREEALLSGISASPAAEHGPVPARSVREVMLRIVNDPAEDLSIGRMASHTGYSRWHFLRVFRKIAGMTPHAFQLLCRLRMARSLLRADAAGSTAAASAGFFDQSHMHRMFKRHHGMTPMEFRKASIKLEP